MVAANPRLIQKTPNVMGGEACIRDSRIAVWQIVNMRRLGSKDHDILKNFPTLTPEDLAASQDYYQSHRAEIDGIIEEQERDDI